MRVKFLNFFLLRYINYTDPHSNKRSVLCKTITWFGEQKFLLFLYWILFLGVLWNLISWCHSLAQLLLCNADQSLRSNTYLHVSKMLKEHLSFGREDSFGPLELWDGDWKNTYMEKVFRAWLYYLNLILKN